MSTSVQTPALDGNGKPLFHLASVVIERDGHFVHAQVVERFDMTVRIETRTGESLVVPASSCYSTRRHITRRPAS